MPESDEEDNMSFIVLIAFDIRAFDEDEARRYAEKICDHYPGYEPSIESIDEDEDG